MTQYADQHGHDVFWMTAEERNDYDARLREVDERIAQALRAQELAQLANF